MPAEPTGGRALVEAVAAITGVTVADEELLLQALTHASARGASAMAYQRLEFLGDRVLALVVADMLFRAYPDAPEGELSLRFNALVNAETLATIAETSGLAGLVRVGSDLRGHAGRKRVNLHADVTEALIAVLYVDGGQEAARSFIERHWRQRLDAPAAARRDAKTELQEWAHQQRGAVPAYRIEKRSGPDHDPVFEVAVLVDGFAEGRGTGRSKREAEQAAATALLSREGVWAEGEDA